MRENRTYGSEGGEAKSLPYPLSEPAAVTSSHPNAALPWAASGTFS